MQVNIKKTAAPSRRLLFLALVLLAGLIFPFSASSSSEEVRVAVLPWKVNSAENMDFVRDAMLDMLSSRIGSAVLATGSSPKVLRTDVINQALDGVKKGESADAAALRVGKKLNLDYVLYGSLTVLGDSLSLDAKLLDVKGGGVTPFFSKGSGLDSVVAMTDNLSTEVVAAISGSVSPPAEKAALPQAKDAAALERETAPVPAPATVPSTSKGAEEGGFIIKAEKKPGGDGFIKSKKLKGLFLSAVAADLDKDGFKEIFLLKKTGVLVGVIQGGGFRVVKEIPTGTAVQNVTLSAIDSDGDGSIEVYVSGVGSMRPESYAIEFVGGEYKVTVTDIKWLLRTVTEGGHTTLIGQHFRFLDGFYGEIRELEKQGSKVVDRGPYGVGLPHEADLYRFGLFNFNYANKDELDLVVLDPRGYLRVYREVEGTRGGAWKESWRSKDRYGGTLNLIEPPEDTSLRDNYDAVPVEGGFFHADLEGDGRTELIIRMNVPGGLGRLAERPKSFKAGSVASFTWDGDFLSEGWRSREVPGYVSDFFVEDLDGDGKAEIVMLVAEGSGMLFGSPKSYILLTEMPL